jgi:histidyl-tRNA synthetase
MAKIQAIRGTHDWFGADAARFNAVIEAFGAIGERFGFQSVHTPVFEATELFARGIGEATDVVAKEMYSFPDRGGDLLTLRPEFTAGLARAYISNGWQQFSPLKLVTHGPLFRYERPQKGRYRQFHQIDAEVIGAAEPLADVELIAFADQLLKALGLGDKVVLQLNTLGDAASRAAYRAALVAHFSAHRADLSADSQLRLDKNPLRILDSKAEQDRPFIDAAPTIDAVLTPEAAAFFGEITAGLDALGIAYTRNPRLVRGLDYYSHTAFEFVTTHLGAQGTVIGGGRYDGLIEQLGGPSTPAVGWAGGIERLALLLEADDAAPPEVAVVPLGEAAQWAAARLANDLRAAGLCVEMAYRGTLKKRMSRANERGCALALILGEDELARGEVLLKQLDTGEQAPVALDRAVEAVSTALVGPIGTLEDD